MITPVPLLTLPLPEIGQDGAEYATNSDRLMKELPVTLTGINTTLLELNEHTTDSVNSIDDYLAVALQSAANSLSVLNFGLLEAVVIGDTDGVNKVFNLLGIGFTPAWILFSDGSKISANGFTLNGNELTLDTAPASGVEVEALGPADSQRAAPAGYKGISVVTNKNGTFTGTVTGHVTTPIWRVDGQADTTTATFTFANDGTYKYVHCFINDDSSSAVLDFEDENIILIDAEFGLTVSQLKFRDNTNLVNARGIASIFGLTNFSFAWHSNNLTSFPLLDSSAVTNFSFAWYSNNLTSFPLLDSSAVTNFAYAWYSNNLTSFPLLDSSAVTNFYAAWHSNNLTSFPLLDSSSVTSFAYAWHSNNLTSFPLLDSSSVTTFTYAWYGNNLTSFPLLDSSSVTSFYAAWHSNNLTSFPAGFFNSCPISADYNFAFYGNALSETAVNDILISINTSGATGVTIGIDGGTNASPTGAGLTAKAALESRGCTVNVN